MRLAAIASAVLALGGCDEETAAIGQPCEVKTDCPGALICDAHQGRGSCQRDHLHGEDTAGEPLFDAYTPGLRKLGEAGHFAVTLTIAAPGLTPIPATWELELRDADGVAAIVAASVSVTARPLDRDAAPVAFAVVERGDGSYHATDVTLAPAGPWEITVAAAAADRVDRVRFAFEVR
jgi:hypothetical protein